MSSVAAQRSLLANFEHLTREDNLITGTLLTAGVAAPISSALWVACAASAVPLWAPLTATAVTAGSALFLGRGCQGAMKIFTEKFPQACRLARIPHVRQPEIHENGTWKGGGRDVVWSQVYDAQFCKDMITLFRERGIASAYDFGCGLHNSYALEMRRQGIDAQGIDGNGDTARWCMIRDLTTPLIGVPPVKCVTCLEVMAKIPKKYEAQVLKNITSSATDMIILSWSPPGQKGAHNEKNPQTPESVIQKMDVLGWVPDAKATLQIRDNDNPKINYWLQTNPIVFVPKQKAE